ncbi:hypothetical protein [Chitinimonas koreensis]|uniref:hypothetical protein n=1 Tax=Chitinimonas koreensis TaxID=356302 RepID=UPI000410C06A|nr:hypothetical protein [Chitinimonas koreensis]
MAHPASAIDLHDGETKAIEGMTHFVPFAIFLMPASQGLPAVIPPGDERPARRRAGRLRA